MLIPLDCYRYYVQKKKKHKHNKFKERIIGKKVQACWIKHGNYQNLFTEESFFFLVIVMNTAAECAYRIFTVSTDKGRETF